MYLEDRLQFGKLISLLVTCGYLTIDSSQVWVWTFR